MAWRHIAQKICILGTTEKGRERRQRHFICQRINMPNAVLKAPAYITVQLHLDSNFRGFVLSGAFLGIFSILAGCVDPWTITLLPDSVSGDLV